MKRKIIGNCELYHGDCMELTARYPDKHFDLAIVDPPYGIGNFVPSFLGTGQKTVIPPVMWNDHIPSASYFTELRRVSARQVIWGANYYNCFSKKGGALIWHKFKNRQLDFSLCEIASLSFYKRVDYVNIDWYAGFYRRRIEDIIHQCQKPVALYKWMLEKYAKPGWKILDTHGGSFSSAIAAYDLGFAYVGIEKDADYYTAAVERVKRFAQTGLLVSAEGKIKGGL